MTDNHTGHLPFPEPLYPHLRPVEPATSHNGSRPRRPRRVVITAGVLGGVMCFFLVWLAGRSGRTASPADGGGLIPLAPLPAAARPLQGWVGTYREATGQPTPELEFTPDGGRLTIPLDQGYHVTLPLTVTAVGEDAVWFAADEPHAANTNQSRPVRTQYTVVRAGPGAVDLYRLRPVTSSLPAEATVRPADLGRNHTRLASLLLCPPPATAVLSPRN